MSKFKVDDATTTRDGRKARIICVDRAGAGFPILALVMNGALSEILMSYTASGKYLDSQVDHGNDLIPLTRLEDLAIDAPILVRDFASEPWCKRHFAGIVNGMCAAWDAGKTSHTADAPAEHTSWLLWKLP